MIKTILVPVMADEADAPSLAAALEIARAFGAHIDALHVRLDPVDVAVSMTSEGGGAAIAAGLLDDLEQAARERELGARRNFDEFCAASALVIAADPAKGLDGPSAQWHVETGQESRWTAVYGMTADLIVAARGGRDNAAVRSVQEAVLTDSGRPLLIPCVSGDLSRMSKTIAIAWKPTREAALALDAAMPFLNRARESVVLTVEEEAERRNDADRVVQYLRWHGLTARAERLKSDGMGAAAALIDATIQLKAGLLVMGGYGHSRLREWVFGGVTEHVLRDAPLPVLMAH